MEKAKKGHSKIEYLLVFLSAVFFIYHLTILIIAWPDIPNQIATHYSNGVPDNFGPKYLLIFIPIISVLIWCLLGILVRKPEKLNYINLTEANKNLQYKKARKIMSVIQNASFIMLLFANKAFIRGAMGLEYIVSNSPFIYCYWQFVVWLLCTS